MKLSIIILACALCQISYSQNRSINFQKGTYSELLARAKKENKLIFIDAYTTWCGPCKWMAKNMFTKDEIADYYNKNFICAKFDMEAGEGIELAKQFEVRCYPNLLFVDGDGNLAHRSAGAAQEVQDYIDLGMTAQDPKMRFASLKQAYEKDSRNPDVVSRYIEAISMSCLPYGEYVKNYFEAQQDELTSAQNWKIMFNYLEDYKSREFQYLLNNKEKFTKLYTMDSVEMKISSTMQIAGNNLIYGADFDPENYEHFKKELAGMNFAGAGSVLFHLELSYFEKNQDLNGMIAYAVQNGDSFLTPAELNSISWTIYENSSNEKFLKKAAEWMQKLTNMEEGKVWMYMDTYASILFKQKKKQDAKTVAETAIQFAKTEGVPEDEYKATVDLLAKINKL